MRGCRDSAGLIQVIKKLRQSRWVVEIQPANHCLKSCGQSIHRCIGTLGSTTGTVSPPTDKVALLLPQDRLKLPQCLGLGLSAHLSHNRAVQYIGAPR